MRQSPAFGPALLQGPQPTSPVPAQQPPLEAVTLGQVALALRARWRWVVLPALAALMASFAYVNTVTPRFTAEAKLLLESRENFLTRPDYDREQQPQIDEQAVASQVQVVMSRDLAREAIKRLDLVGNPEFDPLARGLGPVRSLMVRLGLGQDPLDHAPTQRILDDYYERLLVYPVGKSRIVSVEFRSKDPELAARAANTIAELYIDFQEAAKKDTARSASVWLGSSIETLRGKVAQAEAKVEAFRGRMGLLVGTNNATLAAQQLSDLTAQLGQAHAAQADSQAKAELIRDLIKSGRTFEIPDVANNELIRRLIEQRVGLRTQLAFELRTLLPGHPRVKELNAQLSDLEGQIRGSTERTVRTLENEARIAGSRVETLQAALDAQKTIVAQANEHEVQLRALEREAKAQREQLETYLARYREATARDAENAMPADARVISRAVVPDKPSFPKKGPTMALITLAVIVLSLGAIVARELLGGRPSGPEQASPAQGRPEPAGGAPVLVREDREGETSAPRQGPGLALPEENEGGQYDFEALVGRLAGAQPQDRGRRVLVMGLGALHGAAQMAQGLGLRLARTHSALLVHVDTLEPLAERVGFTDVVAGEASFFEVIERAGGSRLHVVGAGTLESGFLLGEAEGVEIALSAFDQTYDWTICLVQGRDEGVVSLFAPRVDAVVIASNDEPASERLVRLYDAAKAAGAPDVIVAREQPPLTAQAA